jgi:WD40 repeat protein
VNAVALSPDGTRVATGSYDGSARMFEAEVGPLIQRALRVMTRPLNTAELRRYSLPPDCAHVKLWDNR